MRRIAIINQKGGVGKTTTAVNLGAALARLGQRVLVIDMDPQANASLNLGAELEPGEPSTYTILTQGGRVADTVRGTSTPGLSLLPAHLDLSGAELELASAIGRETILKEALDDWEQDEIARAGRPPADVILVDNPPSLGLLAVNGLIASKEVLIAVQTEFFALQGLSKLVEIVQLLRRRMSPELSITGVLACLYDSRLRLAREVLGELRAHFPEQVFKRPIAQNVKLAETPSFGRTIFEYAPESKGAEDYLAVAREFLEREGGRVGRDRSIESTPKAKSMGESDDDPVPGAAYTIPRPSPEALAAQARALNTPGDQPGGEAPGDLPGEPAREPVKAAVSGTAAPADEEVGLEVSLVTHGITLENSEAPPVAAQGPAFDPVEGISFIALVEDDGPGASSAVEELTDEELADETEPESFDGGGEPASVAVIAPEIDDEPVPAAVDPSPPAEVSATGLITPLDVVELVPFTGDAPAEDPAESPAESPVGSPAESSTGPPTEPPDDEPTLSGEGDGPSPAMEVQPAAVRDDTKSVATLDAPEAAVGFDAADPAPSAEDLLVTPSPAALEPGAQEADAEQPDQETHRAATLAAQPCVLAIEWAPATPDVLPTTLPDPGSMESPGALAHGDPGAAEEPPVPIAAPMIEPMAAADFRGEERAQTPGRRGPGAWLS